MTYENHFWYLLLESEILREFKAAGQFKLKIYMKQ